MVNKVNGKISAILVSAIVLIIPSSVSAGQIALTFDDHAITVVGEFIGFQDNAYVLMTENGEMHVPIDMVSCVGEDCVEVIGGAPVAG